MYGLILRFYNSLFGGSLVGRHVYLVTSSNTTTKQASGTLAVHGYVITYDQEFYYLGDTPAEITHGVRKDTVIHWEFLDVDVQEQPVKKKAKKQQTKDKYDTLMDEFDVTDKFKMN